MHAPGLEEAVHLGPTERFNRFAQLLLAFMVATSFHRVEEALTAGIRHVIFRRRDQGVRALHKFAARSVSDTTDAPAMVRSSLLLVHDSLQTSGVAIYEFSVDAYRLRGSVGNEPWPAAIPREDPIFGSLAADGQPASLAAVSAGASTLGNEGIAYALVASGQEIGVLAVRPHANPEDGDFDEREREAIGAVARLLAEALLRDRMRQLAGLLDGLSAGTIPASAAQERAAALRNDPLFTSAADASVA